MVFFLLLNYFNSIKVQLKLILTLRLTKILLIFQFHKGTIKTVNPDSYSTDVSISIP